MIIQFFIGVIVGIAIAKKYPQQHYIWLFLKSFYLPIFYIFKTYWLIIAAVIIYPFLNGVVGPIYADGVRQTAFYEAFREECRTASLFQCMASFWRLLSISRQ